MVCATPPPPPVVVEGGAGAPRKKKYRTIKWSDLQAREELRALHVRPFEPLEQAAYDTAMADDEEAEEDEMIVLTLMKLTRIIH